MESNETAKQLSSLWAPWRVEYFANKAAEPDFLLAAANATDDAAHLVLRRGKGAFLIMNRYPYAVGHLMVVPYQKVAELSDLTDPEKLEYITHHYSNFNIYKLSVFNINPMTAHPKIT